MATNAPVTKTPTFATGKICYLEIPAQDIEQSADFYVRAFGWKARRRGDGQIAFDDTVGEVSGTWVLDRAPMTEVGLMVYVMVANAAKTIEAIKAAGGEIVRPVDPASREVFAWFKDPAGNVLGVYQQPGLKG
jgi:predicted enzyme related to lactoylglutathione lyase